MLKAHIEKIVGSSKPTSLSCLEFPTVIFQGFCNLVGGFYNALQHSTKFYGFTVFFSEVYNREMGLPLQAHLIHTLP